MILIPVLLLAVLVVLASLFLLAKARKENLGRTYVIASWVAAGFGTLIFIFGITAGILMFCFHLKHGGQMPYGKQMQCPMMQNCSHGMSHCSGGGGQMSCGKQMECPMMENCGHGGSHESCGGSHHCDMNMMKGHSCKEMNGDDEIEVKEVIIKQDGNEKPEIKVEVDDKTKHH